MSSRAPSAHLTVLLGPAVEYLVTDADGVYVDATFGRGGHSRLILARLSARGRLIAIDRDPQASAAAVEIADPRFHFVHTRFSRLSATLASMDVTCLQGLLLDLGVSSPQIDVAERGFSWRADAPLDMRMDTSGGVTAAEWLASATVEELARVIRDYGEERFAAPIAKAIAARRDAGRPVTTTAELAAVVAGAIPVRGRGDAAQHPATRTFQALRIHINQELEELALVLEQAVALLASGGRLAVISFHSLEDRLVKRFIERHEHPERLLGRLPLRASELPSPRLRTVARVKPDAAEVAANPRARSAVMRVAQRTAAPLPAKTAQ
ncbi:MAG: 16S rRNA (cytosine(1402)-N(4))-methyltransferase RsmH [Burkholderiales bacterium]|nr:MAG: 16S rRNA (cytosine(1402)-N(4))-methyltransferase RsmH [Burkholderiales bacterium]